MTSSFARAQSTVSQTQDNHARSIGGSRSTPQPSATDPLQPLRAMADRVGKEVEKFAERVDHWYTHGNEDDKAKYHTTVKMIGKFRDVAESNVRELKKQNDAENQGALNKSLRKRIQDVAAEPSTGNENPFEQSVSSVMASIEQSAVPDSASVRELRNWQTELSTWELTRTIIDHYHPEPGTDVTAEKAARLAGVGGTAQYCPKTQIWDRFIIEDDAAREKKIVIKWLQQTARNTQSNIDSILEQWEAVSGKGTDTWTNGWLDTKVKIKHAKRMQGLDRPLDADTVLRGSEGAHHLITRLDPDAPARQKRGLERSDDYYENALWMVCYEMLRRGESWEKISDWCKERNEAWRGVSIGAACETHPDGGPSLAGREVGYLFRRMCLYAARGARMPYERAVYALLSGDLAQVRALCRTWDDHLYAYYNALLLSRFDNYLRQNPQGRPWVSEKLAQKFVIQDAAANLNEWDTSNSRVIEQLMRDASSSKEAKSPIKLIQGALISRTLDDLMIKVGIAAADMLQEDDRLGNLILDPDTDPNKVGPKKAVQQRAVSAEEHHQALLKDPHALRILVHLYLIVRNGLRTFKTLSQPEELAVANVITTYIEFLRVSKRLQLIPLYAAQLPKLRMGHCLARVLPDIKNNDEQKRCVNLIQSYNLDNASLLDIYFQNMLENTGYTSADHGKILDPISRYTILEPQDGPESYLWPGQRIKRETSGGECTVKEDALIDCLQWNNHLSGDEEQTFTHLYRALLAFLMKGRMGAAEKLVMELSVENLSLTKTAAYFGYAFDFTQPGAEEQDEDQVAEAMRRSLQGSGRDSIRPSEVPSAQEHAQLVYRLREVSQNYFDLTVIVRLITCFRQWREEEEVLIAARKSGEQVNTKRIKDLFNTIEANMTLLLNPSHEVSKHPVIWLLFKAYYPELVIAYLSVLQSGAFFIHRDSAVKAMDVATIVADEDRSWLQRAFIRTGRMSELVDALARVSKAMLRLGEHGDGKVKSGKKRGGTGETLRIWDINVQN